MKTKISKIYCACLLSLATLLGTFSVNAHAVENFLKIKHEQSLSEARSEEANAKKPLDKAFAMQKQAAALDSLGKSDEALRLIDKALSIPEVTNNKDVLVTKAAIQFSRNDPAAALSILEPLMQSTRKLADSDKPEMRIAYLSTLSQGFITATFCYLQLEKWSEAINTLADANSILEGPSFYAYRALVYRYAMARAKNPSLANARLEQDAVFHATRDKTHYGVLLRLWQGEEVSKEFSSIASQLDGEEQQDAFAEGLFHFGAYVKFVKGDAQYAKGRLAFLEQIAPFGSIEWIYAKRVFQ